MLNILPEAMAGKTVLVTGHTGFKGSWLSLWLTRLGAKVYGFALEPPTAPAMFELCHVVDHVDHAVGDIRDHDAIARRVAEVCPDIVFHLAAQPIVRLSYEAPLDTLTSNVIGTASVLEAVRAWKGKCAVVVVSSDKCYENREWVWGYRECDPMGGKDPYSMSKGATELVVSAWQQSYFTPDTPVRLASARAGNVIGGGDWAQDRIMTDLVTGLTGGKALELRNPGATRPMAARTRASWRLFASCRAPGQRRWRSLLQWLELWPSPARCQASRRHGRCLHCCLGVWFGMDDCRWFQSAGSRDACAQLRQVGQLARMVSNMDARANGC